MYKFKNHHSLMRGLLVISLSVMFFSISVFTLNMICYYDLFEQNEAIAILPHWIHFDSGTVSLQKINAVSELNYYISETQIVNLIYIKPDSIKINDDLHSNKLNMSIVKQNKKFDFMIDNFNNKIEAKQGEIYVPIYYYYHELLSIDDVLKIADVKLIVKGFVRDTLMNSGSHMSKRFVVNEDDYFKLTEFGKIYSLIEFRLKDNSKLFEFVSKYKTTIGSESIPSISNHFWYNFTEIVENKTIRWCIITAIIAIAASIYLLKLLILFAIEKKHKEHYFLNNLGIISKSKSTCVIYELYRTVLVSLIVYFIIFFHFANYLTHQDLIGFDLYRLEKHKIFVFVLVSVLTQLFVMVYAMYLYKKTIMSINDELMRRKKVIFNDNYIEEKSHWLYERKKAQRSVWIILYYKSIRNIVYSFFMISIISIVFYLLINLNYKLSLEIEKYYETESYFMSFSRHGVDYGEHQRLEKFNIFLNSDIQIVNTTHRNNKNESENVILYVDNSKDKMMKSVIILKDNISSRSSINSPMPSFIKIRIAIFQFVSIGVYMILIFTLIMISIILIKTFRTNEKYKMSILTNIGYKSSDFVTRFIWSVSIVSFVSSLVGVVAAAMIDEFLYMIILSSWDLSKLDVGTAPDVMLLLIPTVVAITVLIVNVIASKLIKS